MGNVTIIDHSKDVMNIFADKCEQALTTVGGFVASEAKDELENDPRRVDTGRLRASIGSRYAPSEKAVYIGTNVEYAIYVHEGTSKMSPNRFLRNAVDRNKDQITQFIQDKLKG